MIKNGAELRGGGRGIYISSGRAAMYAIPCIVPGLVAPVREAARRAPVDERGLSLKGESKR